jgi:HEAT repeat protein
LLAPAGVLLVAQAFCAEGAPNPEETKKLVAVLSSGASTYEKARACQRLADIGTAEAVPALATLLGDEQLSNYGRCGLERIPDPSADAALREALGRLKGNLLIGVVNSIGVRRDPGSVQALAKLARDPASGAAREAFLALGRIATPAALEVLREALSAGAGDLKPAVVEGFLLYAEQQVRDGKLPMAMALYDAMRRTSSLSPSLYRVATRGAILTRGPAGLELLLEQLRSDDAEARSLGLGLLREWPGREALKAVVAELANAKPEMRVPLIAFLAERNDPASRDTVEQLAASDSTDIRPIALRALGRIGGASSVPVLLKALETAKDEGESAAALSSLSQIDAPETDALILKALPGATPANRGRLIGILGGRRNAANAIGELIQLAGNADPVVSQAAFSALAAQARPEDLPQLIQLAVSCPQDALRGAAERCVSETTLKIPNVGARCDQVAAALKKSTDPAVRCTLVRILSMIGDWKAYGVVAPLLKDADANVRDAALRGLAGWSDATPGAALLRFAQEVADPVQRTLALRGLVRMAGTLAGESTYAPRQAIDWLTQANQLVKDRADEKKLILSGLGQLKCVEALLLVQPYLADAAVPDESAMAAIQIARQMPNPDERRMAKAVLLKLVETAKSPTVRGQAEKISKEIPGEPLELKLPAPPAEVDLSKLAFRPLFDGKGFEGWNGETYKAFRVEDGAIVGGSMKMPLAQNEFLCTTRSYANFVLRLECKLNNCNAGIQLRSRRVPASSEVSGYQADMDSTGRYWGCLYDESRRGMLVQAETKKVMAVVKGDDWNQYEIRCEGPRIQLFVNGLKTVDYTEKDEAVVLSGLIALQIHSGPPSEARYRNVQIAELP